MSDREAVVGGSSSSNFAGIFLFVVGLVTILDGVMTLWRKSCFESASVVVANVTTPG